MRKLNCFNCRAEYTEDDWRCPQCHASTLLGSYRVTEFIIGFIFISFIVLVTFWFLSK